jgi:signal transduction histidine kinase
MLDILIIEDNPADVRLFKEYIGESGLADSRIHASSTIEEAAKLLGTHCFDIIVVDLSLPGTHGLETLYTSNQLFRRLPIVILSGTDDQEMAKMTVQQGIHDYLVKGKIDVDSLERSINYAIERNKLRQTMEETQKELIKTRQKLQQAYEKLDQFAHAVSHDMRSPVASILGIVNLINSLGIANDTPQMVGMIEKSATHLDKLLKDLLDLLISHSDVTEQATLLNMEEVFAAVLNEVSCQTKEAEAEIVTDFSEVNQVVYPQLILHNILLNLLTNAIKFRSNRRKLLVEVKTEKIDADTCCFSIKDNGTGMDMDHVSERIFTIFKRFHKDVEGKGVGLYMVKSMLEELGGRIEVESAVNQGATFKVYLKNVE